MTLRRGPSTLASSPEHISSNWPLGTHDHKLLIGAANMHTMENSINLRNNTIPFLKYLWLHADLILLFNLTLLLTCLVYWKHQYHS